MLHTDRDALERAQAPVVETERICEIGQQAAFAESLAGLLLARGQGEAFARRWYLAMALQSHFDLCLADALFWSTRGLKWFPKDAPLLLARGTSEEVAELFAVDPTPSPSVPRAFQQRATDAVQRRATLERAQKALEQALAAAPDLHEARLRLGRVRWRLGRGEEGRVPLEALLVQSTDGVLRYLGHLFLGRIHEDGGRLDEAEVQYRAALGVDPRSQVAAVALSHLLQLAGDRPASREVLASALRWAPRRDAFWSYHMGQAHRAAELFDELRQETLR
jgi:tetratricopeptide (TPR) repeat protein